MHIEIQLASQATPWVVTAHSAFVQDGLYWVVLDKGEVWKFPLCNIISINEKGLA